MAKPPIEIFRKALAEGQISDAEAAALWHNFGTPLGGGEGQNRNAMAMAALELAGRRPVAPLNEIATHQGQWAPIFGAETFSPLYGGWWAMSLSVLCGDRWWGTVGKAWLAAHALAAIRRPRRIILKTPRGASSRTLTGRAAWLWGPAPFSQMPGPRFLWRDPLTAHTLIQRAPIHPCLGLASGRGATIPDWSHQNFGLPLAVLLGRKAQKPRHWREIKLGDAAVVHLNCLPSLPRGLWFRYQWFRDGTKVVATGKSRASTRGTVPLSISRNGIVTYYTTAKRVGDGRWTESWARADDRRWCVQSQDSFLLAEATGTPTLDVLWDASGARVIDGHLEDQVPDPGGNGSFAAIRKLAESLPGLANQVVPSTPEERRALNKITRRSQEIARRLGG